MRNLYEVLIQIQEILEESEDYSKFVKGIESIKHSVSYSPPESMGIWWKESNKYICGSIVDIKKSFRNMNSIEQKIIIIWSNKPYSELYNQPE